MNLFPLDNFFKITEVNKRIYPKKNYYLLNSITMYSIKSFISYLKGFIVSKCKDRFKIQLLILELNENKYKN